MVLFKVWVVASLKELQINCLSCHKMCLIWLSFQSHLGEIWNGLSAYSLGTWCFLIFNVKGVFWSMLFPLKCLTLRILDCCSRVAETQWRSACKPMISSRKENWSFVAERNCCCEKHLKNCQRVVSQFFEKILHSTVTYQMHRRKPYF